MLSTFRGRRGGGGTGIVRGVVLRGNTILQFTDPAQPFRGSLQGIGCFDGFFEDWVIENNVVMVDHWHGITLSGPRNCRILNNTAVDLNPAGAGPPWIRIGPHKDGRPSTNNLIRNNLATDFNSKAEAGRVDHNQEIAAHDAYFDVGGSARIRAGARKWEPDFVCCGGTRHGLVLSPERPAWALEPACHA